MSQNKDTRSASQKIVDLESGVMALYQNMDNVIRDLGTIKDAIKLLGNKIDSIVKASVNGESLTDEVISRIMVENNVEELNQKVKLMVAQGSLKPSEQLSANSFVVGSEINDEGTVVNPRLQFALFALQQELRDKFVGGKVGDTLSLQEGKLKFKVLEAYEIQKQVPEEVVEEAKEGEAHEAEVAQATATSETAEEAPAEVPAAQAEVASAQA